MKDDSAENPMRKPFLPIKFGVLKEPKMEKWKSLQEGGQGSTVQSGVNSKEVKTGLTVQSGANAKEAKKRLTGQNRAKAGQSEGFANGNVESNLATGDLKNTGNGTGWVVKASDDVSPSELSDKELLEKCRHFGLNARLWARKFAGLLPEVAKRRLHRRHGFISIHEFGAKVGGMSEYAVDKILHLAKRLEDKPALRKLFESGAEGWSKIEKVAYVATKETDDDWAEKVKRLSQGALEAYVQSYRLEFTLKSEKEHSHQVGQGEGIGSGQGGGVGSGQNQEDIQEQDVRPYPEPVRFSFPASRDLEFDLRLAKQDLEKQTKQVLSWNETFSLLLKENVENKTKIKVANAKRERPLCNKCSKKRAAVSYCNDCLKKQAVGTKHGVAKDPSSTRS